LALLSLLFEELLTLQFFHFALLLFALQALCLLVERRPLLVRVRRYAQGGRELPVGCAFHFRPLVLVRRGGRSTALLPAAFAQLSPYGTVPRNMSGLAALVARPAIAAAAVRRGRRLLRSSASSAVAATRSFVGCRPFRRSVVTFPFMPLLLPPLAFFLLFGDALLHFFEGLLAFLGDRGVDFLLGQPLLFHVLP